MIFKLKKQRDRII